MKERKEIDEKYKWDLSSYCTNDENFYEKLDKLKPLIEKIKTFEGKLNDDNMLLECWKTYDKFYYIGSLAELYASFKEDEDQRDSKASEMIQKANKILTDFNEASSFMTPEIADFSIEKLEGLKNNPLFKDYVPYINEYIREKGHTFSKEVEAFVSGMGGFLGTNGEIFSKFNNADAIFEDVTDNKGEKFPLNSANYVEYIESLDRKLRESAYKNMLKTYGQNINFLSSNYIASVKCDCFFAKKRNFSSALAMSIYEEEASEEVYKKLIEKVRANVDIIQEFFKVKAKILDLKDFSIYDRLTPIGVQSDGKITFEKAIEKVCEAVSPIGSEYVDLVKKAADEKWMDVYPNKGKNNGGYSCSAYGANPMILLNFSGKESYTSVIAHELGHSIHSYYSEKFQTFQTCNYVIFVAEVASTVNEMLLWRHNIKEAKTKEQKIKLYDRLFELVNGSIYRQTMFSEFEAFAHNQEEMDEPLTKDMLCDYYLNLNKFYYGKAVKIIDETKYEWAEVPHFFTPFYVYKYATGLICALNLSKKIAEGNKDAISKYIKFLSAGSSKNPIALLADAGVNLEEDKTFDEVFSWLRDILEEFKELSK